MTGFKNFLLRGNLVELAVAVIIGTSFGAVITAFTSWLTATLPATSETFAGAKEGSGAFFVNALIAFVLLALVVYFFVVLPYTKAKERWYPSEEGKPADVALLEEIRDLLQAQRPTV